MAQPSITVFDTLGATKSVFSLNPNGQALEADCQPVILPLTQAPLTNGQLRATPVPVIDGGVQPATAASAVVIFTSVTSLALMAANAARKGLVLTQEGPGTLYLLFGAGTASPTNYSARIPAGGYYEVPARFNGVITGIFGSAGTARVQELT